MAALIPLALGWLQSRAAADDAQKADLHARQANDAKLRKMAEAEQMLQEYRPTQMAMHSAALERRLGGYQGAQDALSTLYGQGGRPQPGGAPGGDPSKAPAPGQLGAQGLPDPSALGHTPMGMATSGHGNQPVSPADLNRFPQGTAMGFGGEQRMLTPAELDRFGGLKGRRVQ